MSDASAYVQKFNGEHIGHGHYQGSADCLSPNLAAGDREAWEVGKGHDSRPDGRNPWDVARDCEHDREQGYAYSDYGGGFYWPVNFCRECMVIHGPLSPYPVDYGWDAPTPEQRARDAAWREAGWPNDGAPPIEATVTTD